LNKFDWVDFHHTVKSKYLSIDHKLWWGDDLDVRFYLLKNLMQIKNRKILDIGCNVGITLSFLDKSNSIYGIDIDKYCVSKAKKLNPFASVYQGSMQTLPYDSDSFDIVVMMNVIPYYDFSVPKEDKENFIDNTFAEVNRVLKKHGTLYLTTPNGSSPHYKNRKICVDELEQHLLEYKFTIQGWNSIKAVLPFFPLKYRYIPPKLLCNFSYVWKNLIKNMDENISESKYFYIEAQKI